ncbi:hypothetical protein Dimus_020207, partial [Dionaea muscipula]
MAGERQWLDLVVRGCCGGRRRAVRLQTEAARWWIVAGAVEMCGRGVARAAAERDSLDDGGGRQRMRAAAMELPRRRCGARGHRFGPRPVHLLSKHTSRSNKEDEDNVPLSLKYHTTPQDLILVDTDVDVVGVTPALMDVEVEDNNVLIVGDDREVYGINDVDALMDIVIENTTNKVFKDAYDKVDKKMVEEL